MAIATKKNISKAIKDKTGLDIGVMRSDGCHFFYSDDDATADHLARVYTTSVYACWLHQFSIDQWVEAFETIWADETVR